MLIKKFVTIMVLMLTIALILTACGGKTETTTTTKTVAPTTTTASATLTTTTVVKTTTATTSVTAGPPEVSSVAVTAITIASATLSSSIDKGQGIDRQGYDWGTSSGKYEFSWEETGSFSLGAFSHLITDLSDGTTYYCRSKAHNNKGWGYGKENSFRTLGIPEITGVAASYALKGETINIKITGIDFTDATTVSLGVGITVNSFTVTSDTQIMANISIAADAATGVRTVSVTTEIGTGTLTDGFTVKQVRQLEHTLVWTDSQFDEILHTLAPNPGSTYEVHFHEQNQLTLITTRAFTLWVELQNGKLCITNVQQSFWDELFATGSQYMSYDSTTRVITFNAFSDTVLQTMFDVPLGTLQPFTSVNTAAGSIILTYYTMEEVI